LLPERAVTFQAAPDHESIVGQGVLVDRRRAQGNEGFYAVEEVRPAAGIASALGSVGVEVVEVLETGRILELAEEGKPVRSGDTAPGGQGASMNRQKSRDRLCMVIFMTAYQVVYKLPAVT